MQLGHVVFTSFEMILPFLNSTDEEEVVVHTGECYPMTGFIIVDGVHRVPNRADDPTKFFRVLKSDVPEDVLPRVVGSAHTHPGKRDVGVTPDDVLAIKETTQYGMVYHHHTRTVRLYTARGWIATTSWRKSL